MSPAAQDHVEIVKTLVDRVRQAEADLATAQRALDEANAALASFLRGGESTAERPRASVPLTLRGAPARVLSLLAAEPDRRFLATDVVAALDGEFNERAIRMALARLSEKPGSGVERVERGVFVYRPAVDQPAPKKGRRRRQGATAKPTGDATSPGDNT